MPDVVQMLVDLHDAKAENRKMKAWLKYFIEYPADLGGYDAIFEEVKEFLA